MSCPFTQKFGGCGSAPESSQYGCGGMKFGGCGCASGIQFGGSPSKIGKKRRRTSRDSLSGKKTKKKPATLAEKKYCSCVSKVFAKQSPSCARKPHEKAKGCYNPYAVCARIKPSTITRDRPCSSIMDFKSSPNVFVKKTTSGSEDFAAAIQDAKKVAAKQKKRRIVKRRS